MFAALNMRFASGFDPRSLNPALWLDGADASTMFDATTGGSLVAGGGSIARWEDKSGNGRHVTQGTVVSRPSRTAAALNGRDVVTFDGGDSIASAATSVPYNGASFFVVFRRRSGSATGGMGVLSHNSAGFVRLLNWWSQNNATMRLESTGKPPTARAITEGVFSISTGVISNNSQTQWINGGSPATSIGGGAFADSTAAAIIVGSYAGFLDGQVAELILLPYSATTTQRQKIELYLSQKWNIPLA